MRRGLRRRRSRQPCADRRQQHVVGAVGDVVDRGGLGEHRAGAGANKALAAATNEIKRVDCCVPIQGIKMRLTPSAPTMAPSVLAA